MMLSCPQCEGFVPATLHSCPHCEHSLAPATAQAKEQPLSVRARAWATKLGTGLMISSTAMTLMACYGAPCGSDAECMGLTESDSSYETWGSGYTETGSWGTEDPETGGWETGEPDTEEESDTAEESDTEEEDDETDAGACDPQLVPKLIEYELPVMFSDRLDAEGCTGANEGSCGGDGLERVYEWVAPADGLYLVAVDSGTSMVVYARKLAEGSCGAELGCGVAGPGERGPRLKLEMQAGQRVLLVVDGESHDEQGLFTLSIEQSL